jgi:hypothetical protein
LNESIRLTIHHVGFPRALLVAALAALTALAALAACGESKPPVAATVASPATTAPPIARGPGTPDQDASGRSSAPPLAPDVVANTHLGLPCPDVTPSDQQRGRTVYCGANGVVVAVMMPVDVLRVPPENAEILWEDSSNPAQRGRSQGLHDANLSVSVGIEDGWLFIARVSCGRCRRILGWSFAGDLARMDDSALRVAQQLAGLAGEPRLRTAQEWRSAFERNPPARLATDAGMP